MLRISGGALLDVGSDPPSLIRARLDFVDAAEALVFGGMLASVQSSQLTVMFFEDSGLEVVGILTVNGWKREGLEISEEQKTLSHSEVGPSCAGSFYTGRTLSLSRPSRNKLCLPAPARRRHSDHIKAVSIDLRKRTEGSAGDRCSSCGNSLSNASNISHAHPSVSYKASAWFSETSSEQVHVLLYLTSKTQVGVNLVHRFALCRNAHIFEAQRLPKFVMFPPLP